MKEFLIRQDHAKSAWQVVSCPGAAGVWAQDYMGTLLLLLVQSSVLYCTTWPLLWVLCKQWVQNLNKILIFHHCIEMVAIRPVPVLQIFGMGEENKLITHAQ